MSDLFAARVAGDSPVEEGFRRPFLREAAAHFGIRSWGTVQGWWANRHQILQGPRRTPRYKPRWPAMEVRLYGDFCSARESRRLIQRTWFKRRATAIHADLYPNTSFVFSNGWFRGFLKRYQITHRRVTHASTKIPEEIVTCVNDFLQFVRRNSRMEAWRSITLMSDPVEGVSLQRFPPHLIVNLDETPMPFEFLEGYTYEHKGAISVQGRSERSGWSKRQATLILTLVGDGSNVDLLKPVIVFHGKGNVLSREADLYHPGVEVKFNDTAYNNEALFDEWIRTRLAAYTEGRECLLVIDAASFHKTPNIQAVLKENNITAAMIPAGLTGYLQPLDVGFNGPFKRWLREETELYIDRLDELGTTPDRWSLRDRRVMTTHVVAQAWQRAFTVRNRSMVAGLFKKTGISIHPDGREDHLISIKGIDPTKLKLEVDDWYLPPDLRNNNDISQASTSLRATVHDEFISAAEALGLPANRYRLLLYRTLKEMCRARGLPVSGRKDQLIGRLEDDDAAQERLRQQELDNQSDREMAASDNNQTGDPGDPGEPGEPGEPGDPGDPAAPV